MMEMAEEIWSRYDNAADLAKALVRFMLKAR